jgi:polysaccharide deacetylase family protein (PEP-CTERM system associated)
MKILTFDIEDWYNCDFINEDLNWDRHEVRIYSGVDRILDELNNTNFKATFFCLGWLAEKHPEIIKKIKNQGHHIGCHSYQHQLAYKFSREQFYQDTDRSKKLLEDVIGEEVNAYRAPGFSLIKENISHLEILVELGFKYDASIFPASHDYGGLPGFGPATPYIIQTTSGAIKEFPMTYHKLFGKKFIFSGGGYFRLLPYSVICNLSKKSDYLMTYFHPRDFDPDQKIINSLSLKRKFKSYVGLGGSFSKFKNYLNDFEFMSIDRADKDIDWMYTRKIII